MKPTLLPVSVLSPRSATVISKSLKRSKHKSNQKGKNINGSEKKKNFNGEINSSSALDTQLDGKTPYHAGLVQSILCQKSDPPTLSSKSPHLDDNPLEGILKAYELSHSKFISNEDSLKQIEDKKIEINSSMPSEPLGDSFPDTNTKKKKWTSELEFDKRNALTIFIGNLPLDFKNTKEIFKHLGVIKKEVESIRFRSIPIHPKFKKDIKAGYLSKIFSETISTKNAYIVLRNKEAIDKALKKDNSLFYGNIIRVDTANHGSQFSTFDIKKTIFVGNLPPTLSDDDFRKAFSPFGEVQGVRIIRDRTTSMSKGFGFVLFGDRISVAKSLQAQGEVQIQGKIVRIKRSLSESSLKNEIHKGPNKNINRSSKNRFVKSYKNRMTLKGTKTKFKQSTRPIHNAERRIKSKRMT